MNSNNKSVIKNIPDQKIPLSKKSSQGYIDDLTKKQKLELLELLDRQNKILANKSFISKLPDKGEKIINFKQKILQELEQRTKVDHAAKQLSRLNIANEGIAAMSELEWTGKYTEKLKNNEKEVIELDSDDDNDPLKILAQPTGSGTHKKKIIQLDSEENLIKLEDLEELNSFETLKTELEHIKYIVKKVESSSNEKKRESFKPYKTTKTNVHAPENEKQRENKKNAHWEVTAATPPLIIHGAVKKLDLTESLKLQKDQALKLQEIQAKNAVERLTKQLGMHKIGDLPNKIGYYRIQTIKNSDSSSSDDENYPEVYDEEDNDKRGTVIFTVDTIES